MLKKKQLSTAATVSAFIFFNLSAFFQPDTNATKNPPEGAS